MEPAFGSEQDVMEQTRIVSVTFIEAAVASGKREHISLDLLVSRLSDGTIRILMGLETVLVLVDIKHRDRDRGDNDEK